MSVNVQSVSIVVPPKKGEGCLNSCKFGVCFQNRNRYENLIEGSDASSLMYCWEDYITKLSLARDHRADTVILTGDIEPMGNQDFISWFGFVNKNVLKDPFKIIELQTAGNELDEKTLNWLRNVVGVTTISLSISSFEDDINADITQNKKMIKIKELCDLILSYRINLRLSLNMNKIGFPVSSDIPSLDYIDTAAAYGADQLTIRYLYEDGTDMKASTWTRENRYSKEQIEFLQDRIRRFGTKVGVLPYGAELYSYKGMSIAVDVKCMSEDPGKDIKYLVLGPDAKLYRDWNKTLYA